MIFILAVLLCFNNPTVEVVESKEGYYYTVITTDNSLIKDTLQGYAYPIKIQDFFLSDKKEISLILEEYYGMISYENYSYDSKKERYICIDKYPIDRNEMMTKGFKSGGENINPKYKIVRKNSVARVSESGDKLYNVDLEKIKATGFSKHKKVIDK